MKEIKGNQSGRSMVEMLGVLAIIGVLSIGAVSGYRWAMDKMAANDIVNEVKKRAIVASQQRILGNPLDLTEFEDTIRDTYAVIAQDNYKGSYFAFTLAVDGISKAVCEKLIDMDWMLPVAIDLNNAELTDASTCAETNTILYIFNNDLNIGGLKNSDNGGNNPDEGTPTCGPNEYVDINTNECVKDTKCSVGEFFHSGNQTCSLCPANVGDTVSMTYGYEDNCSKCENGVSVPTWGGDSAYSCLNCPSPRIACGTTCCAEGQVCEISCQDSYCTDRGACHTPDCTSDAECKAQNAATPLCDTFTGTCFAGCRENKDCASGEFCDLDVGSTGYICTQKPGKGTCKTATGTTVGDYTWSTDPMNWWSAENFCKAHDNKHLIDYQSLNCYQSGTENRLTSDGYCCKKGMTCGWYAGTFSDEMLALQKATGRILGGFWTKTLLNNCSAWWVGLSSGSVDGNARHGYTYALCE